MPQLLNTGRQIIGPTDLAPLYVGLSAANSHLLSESAPARPAYALSVAPAAGGIGIRIRIGCYPAPAAIEPRRKLPPNECCWPKCGLGYVELPVKEDSERFEIEVKAHRT